MTVLRHKSGLLTYAVVALVCLFLLGFGLCCFGLIAFLINDLKDVEHINPNTGQVVGVYKRL